MNREKRINYIWWFKKIFKLRSFVYGFCFQTWPRPLNSLSQATWPFVGCSRHFSWNFKGMDSERHKNYSVSGSSEKRKSGLKCTFSHCPSRAFSYRPQTGSSLRFSVLSPGDLITISRFVSFEHWTRNFSEKSSLNSPKIKMPVEIKNVLVCDAVDPSCVELLKSNGISVDYKLKLPENVLIDEAKVKYVTRIEYVSRLEGFPGWCGFKQPSQNQSGVRVHRLFVLIDSSTASISIRFALISRISRVFTPPVEPSSHSRTQVYARSGFNLNFPLQNYDAIIVRSDTKITSSVLAAGAGGRLKVVGRAGVGVDNIDIDAATKNNIIVLKWVGSSL